MKKIFKLNDLKYILVLLLSMSIFLLSFCMEKYYDITPFTEAVLYGIGFAIALVWGILNYIAYLKLGTIYKKYYDINLFVEAMKMNKEEKAELSQYLNDFTKDLEEKGETHANAVKKAISHFQVQEFLEADSGKLFEKQTHWYMLGYILVFLVIALVAGILHYIFTIPVLSLIAFTLVLFSIGFLILFSLYKLMDILIANK